jgi:hypothetical protein
VACDPQCAVDYVDIGQRWIEFQVARGYHAGPLTSVFQEIQTGQVSAEPAGLMPGGNQILDLNSPTLTQTLCNPLRVPSFPGTIIPDGRFALDVEVNSINFNRSAYIERCGSSLHKLINSDFTANSHAVLWSLVDGEIDGLFLPILRPFKLDPPRQVARKDCCVSYR